MTEQEQRIAIAEACGYTLGVSKEQSFANPENKIERKAWFNPNGCIVGKLPDYLHDLNAIHEAEEVIPDDKQASYAHELANLSQSVGWLPESGTSIFRLVRATAAQRAEAFLRTIGKWKD